MIRHHMHDLLCAFYTLKFHFLLLPVDLRVDKMLEFFQNVCPLVFELFLLAMMSCQCVEITMVYNESKVLLFPVCNFSVFLMIKI